MYKVRAVSKLAVLAVGIALCGAAFAQSTAAGNAAANVVAQGGETVFAPTTTNGGTTYAVNTAIAPGLVAGMGTCMGSVSAGFQLKDFGFSSGKTYKDEDCQAGNYAQTLWNQGYKAQAIGVLCSRPLIRYAVATQGGIPYVRKDGVVVYRACPMTPDEWHSAGEPLLDPITGQAKTADELNPPLKPVAVAQVKKTPEQLQHDADIATIEAHAAGLARAGDSTIAAK